MTPSPATTPAGGTEQIRVDMEHLYRMMQSTLVTMEVLSQGEPTADEIAVMRAQMNVLAQRMARIAAQLQAVQPGTVPTALPPAGPTAAVSPAQLRDLLVVMQQALMVLQNVLTDPATDDASLARAEVMLGQLQGMMGQVQALVIQMRTGIQPGVALATQTPTATPRPDLHSYTHTDLHSNTGVHAAAAAQPELGQMEQMLRQLQLMLQQMQSQSASGSGGGIPPTPTSAIRGPTNTPAPSGEHTWGTAPVCHRHAGQCSRCGPRGAAGAADERQHAAWVDGGMMAMMESMMSMMQSMMGGMGGMGKPGSWNGPAVTSNPLARTAQAGNVTVTLLPTNLRTNGVATIDFYVVLDTHAVDLSQDLTQLAVLRCPPARNCPPFAGLVRSVGTTSKARYRSRGWQLRVRRLRYLQQVR